MSSICKCAWAAVLFAAASASSAAATFSFSGTLDSTSPTFQRPEDNGVNPPLILAMGDGLVVYYMPITFEVAVTGTYRLRMTGADFYDTKYTPGDSNYTDDGFFVLYARSFNPASPLTNAVRAFDDVVTGVQRLPDFAQTLIANQRYVLVTTTYGSTATGTFANEISGPGNIAEIPEPSLMLLIGTGLSLIALKRYRG